MPGTSPERSRTPLAGSDGYFNHVARLRSVLCECFPMSSVNPADDKRSRCSGDLSAVDLATSSHCISARLRACKRRVISVDEQQKYRGIVHTLETPRLQGRRVTDNDFEFVVEVWNDQRVAPTVGGQQSESYLMDRLHAWSDHWDAHAFGEMTFNERSTGQRIGWGGLQFATIGVRERLTLGYVVAPSAWGSGYATEIASASVGYAFNVLAAPTVFASVLSTNTASRRVLENGDSPWALKSIMEVISKSSTRSPSAEFVHPITTNCLRPEGTVEAGYVAGRRELVIAGSLTGGTW